MSGPKRRGKPNPSDPDVAPLDADVIDVGPNKGDLADTRFKDNAYGRTLESMRDNAAQGTPSGYVSGAIYRGLTGRDPHGLLGGAEEAQELERSQESERGKREQAGASTSSAHTEYNFDDPATIHFEHKLKSK
jgi:hypothetical protein